MTAKPRTNARLSSNYAESLYHRRRMLSLHFNLDLPLYPFCFEDQIRDTANAWFDSPGVSFLMLIALESGESIYEIGGKTYTVVPGSVLLVPEFTPYLFRSWGYQHKYVLEIKGCHLSSILSSLRLNRTALYEVRDFPAFLADLKAVGERVDTGDRNEFLHLMGKCYELLGRLAMDKLEKQSLHSLLPRILEYLEQDFDRKLTIADLEQYTGISKMSLIRMVKKHTGMTPMQYRIARKMERAIYFLQVPEMTVKEIAYRLGYCSQFYFAEEFKRLVGQPPTAYRHFQQTLALRTAPSSHPESPAPPRSPNQNTD